MNGAVFEQTARAVAALLPFLGAGMVLVRVIGLRDPVALLVAGFPTGLAAGTLAAAWCGVLNLALQPWIGVICAILVAAAVATTTGESRAMAPADAPPASLRVLGLAVAAAAISYLLLYAPRQLPHGWDPAFHVLLARKALLDNLLPSDWRPFEDLPTILPTGFHALMGLQSRWAGVSPAHCFNVDLALLTASSAGLVGLIAEAVLARSGWIAALVYAFGGNWGAIDYGRWGGITSAFGMCLLMVAMLFLVSGGEFTIRRGIAVGALLAAVGAGHHHSLLVAGGTLGALLTAAVLRDHAARPAMAAAGAAAVLAGFPVWWHFLRSLPAAAMTRTFDFREELAMLATPAAALASLGWLPVLATLIWLALPRLRTGLRSGFILLWLLVPAAGFILFRGVYPLTTWLLADTYTTALSPLRFWTDLAYPAAVATGLLLAKLRDRLRGRRPWDAATLALLALGLFAQTRSLLGEQGREVHFDPWLPAETTWLAAHTPPDALIVTALPWVGTLAWRATTATPLPASEMTRDPTVLYKREKMLAGPEFVEPWALATGRPVFLLLGPLEDPRALLCHESAGSPIYRFVVRPGETCPE